MALGFVPKCQLVEVLKEKLGFEKTCEIPGLAKITLYGYLSGKRCTSICPEESN